MSLRRTHALAAVVSTILLAACGGNGDDGTAPTPAFTLSATPTTLEVQAGGAVSAVAAADVVSEGEAASSRSTVFGTGAINVSVTRLGGFAGAVTVSVQGQPSNVTAESITIPAGSTSGSITVNAASTAVVGSATLTLTATGIGVAAQTASVQLTIAPPPAFALTMSPTSLTIAQGLSASATVNIARSGGFTGAVSLSTTLASSSGITVTFSPASTAGVTSTIAVTVASTVAPGFYPVSVQGSGAGVANQSTGLVIIVNATIVLTTSPAALSVQQGASATTTLTIARTNFTGSVNLTSTGEPAGVTVTFNPPSTTATTSTVTISVAAGVAPATYQLTLRGTGFEIAGASVTLSLNVTTAGSGNPTFTFCAQSGLPLWFAYQDFGGPWTQVVAANHVYKFNINARGVVAWVLPQGTQTYLVVYYGSQQELATRGSASCVGNGSIKTINVTALGVGANEHAYVTMGSAFGFVQAGSPNPFQVTNVPDGVVDLIGVKSAAFIPNSIVIQRARNDANGANLTVDFATGVAPVTRTATIANLGAEQASFGCNLFSKNNGYGLLSEIPQASTTSTQTWKGVPDASVIDGDFHVCTVYATPAGAAPSSNPGRGTNQWNKFAADRTYTLPDAITTPPTLTLLGTSPYVTLTTNWSIQSAQFNARWMETFIPASGPVTSVTVIGLAGYFGSGPVQLAIPAFGAGFNPAHGLQPGIPVTWGFTAAGGNVFGAVEGAMNTFANVQGAPFTP